jgi:glycine/D-amino acid oxidase-like deaminating enzyme/nitrite reductase/ring-hydroxylating ferredoxin subunit
VFETTSDRNSLWLATAPTTHYPLLDADVEVDVAVVGGGVAGLTTALLLKRAGLRVAVLEARRVASGVTGCTTAKVSALQSSMYSTIRSRHGEEAAQVYAAASTAGVEQLASLVSEEGIDCGFARRDAYTYALQPKERAKVEREAAAADGAGLPVDFVESFDVPFPVHGAVRLADQVQIQPVTYVQGLAAAVDGDGSQVFEQTRVCSVREGRPARVGTEGGAEVRAQHVVIATHFPLLDRGLYFARMEPQRSYCIAARLAEGTPPVSMPINVGTPTRSLREHDGLLIVGGEGHATGSGEAVKERFVELTRFAREHWQVAEVVYRWSAQDPIPYDHLPMIGPYRPGAHNLWVSAGFMKWGFSSATFGAQILAAAIQGRRHEWASTFTPSRVSPKSLPEVARLGAKFAGDMVKDRVRRPQARAVEEIPAGEARVVPESGAGRMGVYRDEDGGLHAVSIRCTHQGCILRFNDAETSWDCPCHGSRFDVDGNVLEGPAVRPLAKRDVDSPSRTGR